MSPDVIAWKSFLGSRLNSNVSNVLFYEQEESLVDAQERGYNFKFVVVVYYIFNLAHVYGK